MIICAHRRTRSSGGSQNSSATLKGENIVILHGCPSLRQGGFKHAGRIREAMLVVGSFFHYYFFYLQLVEAAHPVAIHKRDALQRQSAKEKKSLTFFEFKPLNSTVRVCVCYAVKLLKGRGVKSIAHLERESRVGYEGRGKTGECRLHNQSAGCNLKRKKQQIKKANEKQKGQSRSVSKIQNSLLIRKELGEDLLIQAFWVILET